MRNTLHTFRVSWLFGILAVVLLAAGANPARAADERSSVVIVFKDGHRESFATADIARIDFNAPAMVVFKDGHQQKISAADVTRIEFGTSAQLASPAGRGHFVGKWEVGEGNGRKFLITLRPDGEATKSIGVSHGTWTFVDGEARIAWDDGWHDAIRKVGAKHEKFAYEPGKSFSDKPTNVTEAVNTAPRPI